MRQNIDQIQTQPIDPYCVVPTATPRHPTDKADLARKCLFWDEDVTS